MLFDDDPQRRQDLEVELLRAQLALLGGEQATARRHLDTILLADPSHELALDLLPTVQPTRSLLMTYTPVPVPAHLPQRLTITLWDFSWYVRTGPGEPFEDLDKAFAEAVDRGYNTVRICAMPYLLFGSGLDTTAVRLGPLGNGYAQRVRWYDVTKPTVIDGRTHLLALFEAAKRHDCFVIVSSWEYQQSSSFADTPAWCEALMSIEPDDRAQAQAVALADLIDFLAEHGLDDRIAFTEIHNEVQAGHLAEGLTGDEDERLLGLKPRLERALDAFHQRHPERPVTVNYSRVPVGVMRSIPETIDVLVTHPYIYGVLQELYSTYGLRGPVEDFDQDLVTRDLLRPDAPKLPEWAPDHEWRWEATIVAKPEIYVHDWCDPEAFDRWLYQRYQAWEHAMITKLEIWLSVARDWAEPTASRSSSVRAGSVTPRVTAGSRRARSGRVLPDCRRRVNPGRGLGDDRVLQRRAAARHVVRHRPPARVHRGLPRRRDLISPRHPSAPVTRSTRSKENDHEPGPDPHRPQPPQPAARRRRPRWLDRLFSGCLGGSPTPGASSAPTGDARHP